MNNAAFGICVKLFDCCCVYIMDSDLTNVNTDDDCASAAVVVHL